jgi:hypothetical protein
MRERMHLGRALAACCRRVSLRSLAAVTTAPSAQDRSSAARGVPAGTGRRRGRGPLGLCDPLCTPAMESRVPFWDIGQSKPMHDGHEVIPTPGGRKTGMPSAGSPARLRNGSSPPATSCGTTTASATRGVLVTAVVAILCTACSFAGLPPAGTPRASAPLPPGVTGPILPPSYVPEPGAILALALVGNRLTRTTPPPAREAARRTSAPDSTHGGG